VKKIVTRDEDLDIAYPGESVTLTIEDEIDISRGDMIVRKDNVPTVRNDFEAYVCWMSEKPMEIDKQYILQHTTHTTQVFARELVYRMNVDSLNREEADKLSLNEIGRVKLKTSQPLFFDAYQINKKTGSFIIIDPATNVTVGAGMMRAGSTVSKDAKTKHSSQTQQSPDVVWEPWNIPRAEREKRNGHKAQLLWMTGISGAGKSTIAKEVEKRLWDSGKQTMVLDGDQVRHGLNGDLGFSPSDRAENIRRIGHTARLFFEHGNIVICTFVSPYREDRDMVKSLFPEGDFKEIHITCDPKTAQERDPKGLYKKAEKGEIKGLTGYDADHEAPKDPTLVINTDECTVEEAVEEILNLIS
jgi:bifunctional enzyme CysN/CysC